MKTKIASHFKTLFLSLAMIASAAPSFTFAITGPVYPWPGGDNVDPKATDNNQARQNQQKEVKVASVTEYPAAQTQQENPIMSMLGQMLSSGMSGPSMSGPGMGSGDMGEFGGNNVGNESFPGMAQIPGSGEMEHCGNMNGPTQVQAALLEAREFLGKCSLARRGANQKIAINDYSGGSTPMMYIFDLEGNCLGRTAVSYGNGEGRVKPLPCSDDGDHLTPAGFHLTSVHNGAKYDSSRAIGMVGLEGQDSVGRGIIIHPAKSPGTASSWGCSGVGYDAFQAVKATLGEGSLVYNFFGQATGPSSCSNNPGLTGQHNFCRLDGGGNPVPASSTAGGSPSISESSR